MRLWNGKERDLHIVIGDALRTIRVVAVNLGEISVIVGELNAAGDVVIHEYVIERLRIAVEHVRVAR